MMCGQMVKFLLLVHFLAILGSEIANKFASNFKTSFMWFCVHMSGWFGLISTLLAWILYKIFN